ncbi:GNAT family N-acetyltransferase [Nocardioides dilutus]
MREDTRRQVEAFWRDLFGVTEDQLWRQVSVRHPHGRLGDYEGWYVAWRGPGVHVSAPASADPDDVAGLLSASPSELQEPAFWQAFAARRSLRVIGPATHHYLDEDPGVPSDVEQVDPVRLALLRGRTTPAEWEESGIPEALDEGGEALAVWGTVGETDRPWVPALLGGAVLTETAGARRDIGLLVAQDARGRGVGLRLGQAAASYAISWHGWARWTAQTGNEPSLRLAARLGFESYATQLALRLEPAG